MEKQVGVLNPNLLTARGKILRLVFFGSPRQVELVRALQNLEGVDIFRVRGVSDVLIVHSDLKLASLNLQLRVAASGLYAPDSLVHFDTTRIIKFGGNLLQEARNPNVALISVNTFVALTALVQDWNGLPAAQREALQRNNFLLTKPAVKHSADSLRAKCLRRSIVLLSLANQSTEGQHRFEAKVLKDYYKDDKVQTILAGHLESDRSKHFQYALDLIGNPYDIDKWLDQIQTLAYERGEEVATRTIDVESTVREDLVTSLFHPAIDDTDIVSLEKSLARQREINPDQRPRMESVYGDFMKAQKALSQLDAAFRDIDFAHEAQHLVEEIQAAVHSLDINRLKQPVMDLLGLVVRFIGQTHSQLAGAARDESPGRVLGQYRKTVDGRVEAADLESLFRLNALKNVGSHEEQNPEHFGKIKAGLSFEGIIGDICVGLTHLRYLSPIKERLSPSPQEPRATPEQTPGTGPQPGVDGSSAIESGSLPVPAANARGAQQTVKVFVSYSHLDQKYLTDPKSLMGHLKGLNKHAIEFLHDKQILTSENFNDAIRQYIDQSDIVMALVSQPFLDSDYCQNVEAVRYLQQRKDRGLRVFPVILSACHWHEIDWLKETQSLPGGGKNIEEHYSKPGKRKSLFSQIRDELLKTANGVKTPPPIN